MLECLVIYLCCGVACFVYKLRDFQKAIPVVDEASLLGDTDKKRLKANLAKVGVTDSKWYRFISFPFAPVIIICFIIMWLIQDR